MLEAAETDLTGDGILRRKERGKLRAGSDTSDLGACRHGGQSL